MILQLENQTLENASVMVAAFRDELVRVGRHYDARALKGLEVSCVTDAQLALLTVQSIDGRGVSDARRYTIEALRSALSNQLKTVA